MQSKMHPKGGRRRKTQKKRGGSYGFSGALATGAPDYIKTEDQALPGRAGNTFGGRRKRKDTKKTRKVKRGGLRFGQANAGFTGQGTARGLGGYQDVSDAGGKAEFGSFANHGAQPGSGLGSFVKAA